MRRIEEKLEVRNSRTSFGVIDEIGIPRPTSGRLNAGVEAARAGEAGRGLPVVARNARTCRPLGNLARNQGVYP